jgi:teichuronic acid biosynthesis glycosyltransferase TuaG
VTIINQDLINDQLVSIVMPNYNCGRFINDALESVLRQTYARWEALVVDDCSTDSSCATAEQYQSIDKRFRLIKLPKRLGPASARNYAIKEAKGRYLAFLDSDDLWDPEFLSKSLNFMQVKCCKMVYSSYRRVDEVLKKRFSDFIVPEKVSYHDLLKTCPIQTSTVVYDTVPHGKFYAPDYLKRQDYILWLSTIKAIGYACGIKEPLVSYRIRRGSISRNKLKAAAYQWKVYREVENVPFGKALYYFFCYAVNGMIKYLY